MRRNPLRFRPLCAAVAVAGMSLIGCSDAPTESSHWTDALDVSAEVSRPTFVSGDSTTIRVIYTNNTTRTIETALPSATSCQYQFEVRKGTQKVAPGGPPPCSLALYAPLDLAPGQSWSVEYVWRGENGDWAVQLTPGKYTVYGLLRMGPSPRESPGVPIEILH